MNTRFYKLIELIFCKTIGIKKNKNAERHGASPELFTSHQLGRDLVKVDNGEALPEPGLYLSAIGNFFNAPSNDCIEKTVNLFESLLSEGYITDTVILDAVHKCTPYTISFYKQAVIDLWLFYFSQYSTSISTGQDSLSDFKTFSISKIAIEDVMKKQTQAQIHTIENNLDYYINFAPLIQEQLKTKNPNYAVIEREYTYFFKRIIEDNVLDIIPVEEQIVFFNGLYAISDVLDKTHQEDSYMINVEMLAFFNKLHADDYKYISIHDIQIIQGCTYAIAVSTPPSTINIDIQLTRHNNLTKKVRTDYHVKKEARYAWCLKAFASLLNHEKLNKINNILETNGFIERYEERIHSTNHFQFSKEDQQQLYVLSLIYSNIAATHIQYTKHKIGTEIEMHNHLLVCEQYQAYTQYLRYLLVKICYLNYGSESEEYQESIYHYANYFNSLAVRFYYQKNYALTIAVRSVLYNYYISINAKEKADRQIALSPFDKYEQHNNNTEKYRDISNTWFKQNIEGCSFLSTQHLLTYDEYKSFL